MKKDSAHTPHQLLCSGRLISLETPLVMGIVNLSPDSFYPGSRVSGYASLLEKAEQMIAEGADILDLGAQSTRPGSDRISKDEEMRRMLGAVEALLKQFPDLILSIDSYIPDVASYAIKAGASILNDVSGGGESNEMIYLAGSLGVPYICMHMHGSVENMHHRPNYTSVTTAVVDFFIKKIEICRQAAVNDVILDPGFGFSKNAGDNFQLLREFENLRLLGKPLLAGISRKSTIYKTLRVSSDEALNGTTVLNTVALMKGAAILRVHDVKEAREAITLMSRLQ